MGLRVLIEFFDIPLAFVTSPEDITVIYMHSITLQGFFGFWSLCLSLFIFDVSLRRPIKIFRNPKRLSLFIALGSGGQNHKI